MSDRAVQTVAEAEWPIRDPDLEAALDALARAPALYRPTSFWAEESLALAAELDRSGVDAFRCGPLALAYFVPTYGTPANGVPADFRDALAAVPAPNAKAGAVRASWLSGEAAALADYRVLLAADDPAHAPALHRFSESDVGAPIERFEFDGRAYSRSSLNYLLGLAMLKRHLGGERLRTVLEIGGGFGTLGEILLTTGDPAVRYVDIDIPPVQWAAEQYLRAVLGASRVTGYRDTAESDTIAIDSLADAATLCSWQIERLEGEVDLFVNFISFQEMEPAVVRNYLTQVDRLGSRWVLLRNMREGKQRRTAESVGVETPILSDDYLDMLPRHRLVDRSVQPFGFRTADGFHSELLLLRRD